MCGLAGVLAFDRGPFLVTEPLVTRMARRCTGEVIYFSPNPRNPTLTHHLNRMEAAGLVTRRRDPDNRRVHQVELTRTGEEAFQAMRRRVAAFDKQLRAGFNDDELAQLRGFLDRLRANAKGGSR